MARSPEAQLMRQRDRDYRDTQHQATVMREGDRKAAEPVNGTQPWPVKTGTSKKGPQSH